MRVIQTISLNISATHAESSSALSFVTSELASFNSITSDLTGVFNILHVRLALDEALLNSIEHGCHCGDKKTIKITARFSPTLLEIQVEDSGSGFYVDQSRWQSKNDFEKVLFRGIDKGKGWGVAIIQSVASQVYWNLRGNLIGMVFQRG